MQIHERGLPPLQIQPILLPSTKATTMRPIITIADLAEACADVTTERDLAALLNRCADMATDPALDLALDLLADMPPEIAANWIDRLDVLANILPVSTDGPAICRAVAQVLARFAEVRE